MSALKLDCVVPLTRQAFVRMNDRGERLLDVATAGDLVRFMAQFQHGCKIIPAKEWTDNDVLYVLDGRSDEQCRACEDFEQCRQQEDFRQCLTVE